MSYATRRAAAIIMATGCTGWGRPLLPETGRSLGRVLMRPMLMRGKWIGPGLVPHDVLLDREFFAREKRQNRRAFG